MDLKSELPLLTGQKVGKVEKDFPTYFGTTLSCKDPWLEKYSPYLLFTPKNNFKLKLVKGRKSYKSKKSGILTTN